MLQFMGSQRVGHDRATEQNGTEHSPVMVVQQQVVILEFSPEKMSTRLSIPPSSSTVHLHTFVNDFLKNSSHIVF